MSSQSESATSPQGLGLWTILADTFDTYTGMPESFTEGEIFLEFRFVSNFAEGCHTWKLAEAQELKKY